MGRYEFGGHVAGHPIRHQAELSETLIERNHNWGILWVDMNLVAT